MRCMFLSLFNPRLPPPCPTPLIHIPPIQFPPPDALSQTILIVFGNVWFRLDFEHPQTEFQEGEFGLVFGTLVLSAQSAPQQ